MRPVVIILRGTPMGKPRPRAVIRPGARHASFYTPAKAAKYERNIATAARVVMHGRPIIEGPVSFKVVATFTPAASWSATKRAAALAGSILPTKKPDFDNLEKMAADALKGIVWRDDAQVVDSRIIKIYGTEPSLAIEIEEIVLTQERML